MATKKPQIDIDFRNNVIAKTATRTPTATDDIIESNGVGLKKSEWGEIIKIAAELGMTRHALTAALLRYGLKEYKAGKIKTKTAKTLDL